MYLNRCVGVVLVASGVKIRARGHGAAWYFINLNLFISTMSQNGPGRPQSKRIALKCIGIYTCETSVYLKLFLWREGVEECPAASF